MKILVTHKEPIPGSRISFLSFCFSPNLGGDGLQDLGQARAFIRWVIDGKEMGLQDTKCIEVRVCEGTEDNTISRDPLSEDWQCIREHAAEPMARQLLAAHRGAKIVNAELQRIRSGPQGSK